jgi:hypothetical protein
MEPLRNSDIRTAINNSINAELLKIVSDPPDWIKELPLNDDRSKPYFLTDHLEPIKSFLNATTDSVRLVRASRAARKILAVHELDDLEDLRSSVQASELFRAISYEKQTDHSAHTLYLYLLGIYLFLSCKPIREGIATFLKEKDPSKLVIRFLFQWSFVSLLHDIGYVFHGRSKNEIRAVDRMFRPSTITRYMGSASSALKQRVSRFISKMEIKPFEPIQNPEDMLTLLRNIPWGKVATFRDDIFESFQDKRLDNDQITVDALETYAYQVASSGYYGISEGTVDHAVASGLFLFRYSTFWYYLAREHGYEEIFASYYDGGYPEKDVTAACFAAAAHNVMGVHAKGIKPLVFESNPIMYLGILCDELQKWDRFPAGTEYLANLEAFEQRCTDSERITVTGIWDGTRVSFKFSEAKLAEKVIESLERLESPSKFVEVKSKS